MDEQKPTSPTGTPVLPVSLVPLLVALGGIAFAVDQFTPDYTVAHRVAHTLIALLAMGGMASPGLKKSDGA